MKLYQLADVPRVQTVTKPSQGAVLAKPTKAKGKTVYHGTDKDIQTLNIETASEGAAFGKGVYLSTLKEDAGTWGKNVKRVEIKGKVLKLDEANSNTVKAFEKHLDTKYYSNRLSNEKPVTNIELYNALIKKYSKTEATKRLESLGYVGVEHATPRMAYRGKATNIVIFNPKNVKIKPVKAPVSGGTKLYGGLPIHKPSCK